MSRVAVVSGAARGIGLAISKELLSGGWTVVGCDVSEDVDKLTDTLGDDFSPFRLDVIDEDAVRRMAEEVYQNLGPVEGLVNNAGITRDSLLMRMDRDNWQAVIDVNLTGTYVMSKIFSRGMMRQRSGSIVNVSSVVGFSGSSGQANYAASKAGIIGFTKSLCHELGGRGVRVNAVAPGFVETDMTSGLSEEVREGYAQRIPLRRIGAPEDVARVVRFLLGEESSYISGVVIPIDGGMTS
ncbi:3-oxoacyl-[acyl-carrier-protein] reductase [Candidatus Fermentibacteria bacterium]|nr:3-oxoacyl-[acyl-carrier-protein] reductase [Candidatus Fermentibacteria bacterium]